MKDSGCMETTSVVRKQPKTVAFIMVEFIGCPLAVPKRTRSPRIRVVSDSKRLVRNEIPNNPWQKKKRMKPKKKTTEKTEK